MRRDFFGPTGDTAGICDRLRRTVSGFTHHELDIRDRDGVARLFEEIRPDLVVHCAAQPSHDLAASRPFDDFDINAVGDAESARGRAGRHARVAVRLHVDEQGLRRRARTSSRSSSWRRAGTTPTRRYRAASTRRCGSTAARTASSAPRRSPPTCMVQEYGRYFGMPTVCFRGGCLTGPEHSGAELHGFLSLPRQCDPRGADVPDLRLQGQAGPRQHPFATTSAPR